MLSKDEFINLLSSDKELNIKTKKGLQINVNIDYTELIKISLDNVCVYYGNEIETEEQSEIELSKAYKKYINLYTLF